MTPPKSRPRTRRWFILALFLYAAVFAGAMSLAQPQRVSWLRTFGVAAFKPQWIDLRVISAAIHERDAGGNPYLSNPTDPLQRRFNYPRIWLSFRFLKSNTGLWIWMLLQAVGAAIILAWFSGRLTGLQSGFLGLLLFSPSVSLLVERANTDLFIFALLGLSLLVIYRYRNTWLGGFLIASASVAKLYPAVVLATFPGLLPRKAYWAWIGLGIVFGLYLALEWSSVSHALKATPVGWLSYGTMTIAVLVARGYDLDEEALRYFLGAVTLLCLFLLAMGLYVGAQIPPSRYRFRNSIGAAGFMVGALVYLSTFFAGASFDYRLVFLLLGCRYIFRFEASSPSDRFWVAAWYVVCATLLYSPAVWGRTLIIVHAGAAAALVPVLGYFLGRIVRTYVQPVYLPTFVPPRGP